MPTEPISDAADDLASLQVAAHLHCRRCGYDLVGLDARSHCPECGLDIWETVTHTVDPTLNRLPRLLKPRQLGNSVALLTGSTAAAVLLQSGPAFFRLLADAGFMPVATIGFVPEWIALLSPVAVAAGFAATVGMAGSFDGEPSRVVRRDLRFLIIGLVSWGLTSAMHALLFLVNADAWQLVASRIAAVPCAIVGLWGLRGMLRVIGERSRAYRRAQGARQSSEALIAALVTRALGYLLLLVADWHGRLPSLATFGEVVIWASTLLLSIGLVYLVGNGWIIRRSLVKPPPDLRDITGRPRNLTEQAG